jgi:hypothetical protein
MARSVPFVVGLVAALASSATAQASSTFSLVLFNASTVNDKGARCIDGSPSGYYISPSSNASTTFVIFLEGGGACWSNAGPFSCWLRYNTSLGSSKFWSSTIQMSDNFFVRDSTTNPFLYDATYIYVPYCSGDVYGGQQRAIFNECRCWCWTTLDRMPETLCAVLVCEDCDVHCLDNAALPFFFAGHLTVSAVLDDLTDSYNLGIAQEVLLSGSSAGG